MEFAKLESRVVGQIAKLHIEGISTGFISSLGIDFVTALYDAIAQSKSSFGFVAGRENRIFGFIVFTVNLNALYKSAILKKGAIFTLMLVWRMFSYKTIKRVFETLFYPARIKKINLPSAELLSIVITQEQRKKGLATELVRKGLVECARRGIEKVKVLVAADNKPANKLYLKCGFELVGQIENHGVLSNIYVAETGKKGTDEKFI